MSVPLAQAIAGRALPFGMRVRALRRTQAPRPLAGVEVAAYLGKSGGWWSAHAEALHRAGFPRPLPFVGGFDKEAVDRWLDSLHKGKSFADFDAAWTRAAGG